MKISADIQKIYIPVHATHEKVRCLSGERHQKDQMLLLSYWAEQSPKSATSHLSTVKTIWK